MNEVHGIQRSAAALLALFVLIGCGDDDDGEEEKEPPPPELTIAQVRTHSGATWQRGSTDPLDLGCPPSPALVVTLGEPDPDGDARSLKNWLLRAPGGCFSRTRCGYVSFELSSGGAVVYRTDTALPEFGIAARDVSSPPGISAGTYGLRATLRSDDGAEFLLGAEPVSAAVELTFTTPANCVVDPGTDAGSDAGG